MIVSGDSYKYNYNDNYKNDSYKHNFNDLVEKVEELEEYIDDLEDEVEDLKLEVHRLSGRAFFIGFVILVIIALFETAIDKGFIKHILTYFIN